MGVAWNLDFLKDFWFFSENFGISNFFNEIFQRKFSPNIPEFFGAKMKLKNIFFSIFPQKFEIFQYFFWKAKFGENSIFYSFRWKIVKNNFFLIFKQF